MRTLFSLIMLTFVLLSCSSQADDMKHKEISENIIIIDVRTQGEYDAEHIEGAILMPYTEIDKLIEQKDIPKNAQIALYCRSGRRSGIAKQILEKKGYTNTVNYGGYSTAARKLDRSLVSK